MWEVSLSEVFVADGPSFLLWSALAFKLAELLRCDTRSGQCWHSFPKVPFRAEISTHGKTYSAERSAQLVLPGSRHEAQLSTRLGVLVAATPVAGICSFAVVHMQSHAHQTKVGWHFPRNGEKLRSSQWRPLALISSVLRLQPGLHSFSPLRLPGQAARLSPPQAYVRLAISRSYTSGSGKSGFRWYPTKVRSRGKWVVPTSAELCTSEFTPPWMCRSLRTF